MGKEKKNNEIPFELQIYFHIMGHYETVFFQGYSFMQNTNLIKHP